MTNLAQILRDKIAARDAVVGVMGLGYVGLPLATAVARSGFKVLGFDTDGRKVASLNGGRSYIGAVPSSDLAALVAAGLFRASEATAELADCDVIAVCVPTPLTPNRDPDLSFVVASVEAIAAAQGRGQLVVLESTTYPGTTEEVVKPILERNGLRSGVDLFLGYSPEREDPGNPSFRTVDIPKVVSGDGAEARGLTAAFYGSVVKQVVAVSSPSVAEAVKMTENVFRAVNIALVNELKVIYAAMGIDVWEVIDAASTKPFGYMAFQPGPGLGGHCIPIDPFYLAWRARQAGQTARFVELAGDINVGMPGYVVGCLEAALRRTQNKELDAATIMIIGVAYKRNIDDIRESPTLVLMDLLEQSGASVQYHDPHVPEIMATREHQKLAGRLSVDLTGRAVQEADAILIATDHDLVDYNLLASHARLIVDTRNAMARRGISAAQVSKA